MLNLTNETVHRILAAFAAAHPLRPIFDAGYEYDIGNWTQEARYPLLYLRLPILWTVEIAQQGPDFRTATLQIAAVDRPMPDLKRDDYDRLRVLDDCRSMLESIAALFANGFDAGVSLRSAQIEGLIETTNPDGPIGADMMLNIAAIAPDILCPVDLDIETLAACP
jgi:hypothetical protein